MPRVGIVWHYADETTDLSLRLTGRSVPEPAISALMVLGVGAGASVVTEDIEHGLPRLRVPIGSLHDRHARVPARPVGDLQTNLAVVF
jgi:hypothetical protein